MVHINVNGYISVCLHVTYVKFYHFQRSTMNSAWETLFQSCAVYSVSSTACHLVWCTMTTAVLATTSNSPEWVCMAWEIQVNSGYMSAVYATLGPLIWNTLLLESWKDMCSTDWSLTPYPCMHAVFSSSSHCVFSGLQTPTEWYLSKGPGLQLPTSGRSEVYSMECTSTCLSEDFSRTRDQSYRMPCSWSSLLNPPTTLAR